MSWLELFDVVYKIITGLVSLGVFALVARILLKIGGLLQWQRTIDKEVSSHGSMLQQVTGLVNRIWGRLESGGRSQDSGKGNLK